MTSSVEQPVVPVFVSYSHDSPNHLDRVAGLVERLRAEGVDCHFDGYEEAPPEGWPAWMAAQVRDARYVLVVCTVTYNRRVTGTECDGIGLGARWEGGLITQDLYERGGRNDKFIPVVFEEADVREIPVFLKSTTRYNVSTEEGYERLYRRLTGQPRAIRPALGSVRPLPPEPFAVLREPVADDRGHSSETAPRRVPGQSSTTDYLLLREPVGSMYFVPLVSVEIRDAITAVLLPRAGTELAFLSGLASNRFARPTLDVAFGLTADRAHVASVVRTFEGGSNRFTLTLTPEGPTNGAGTFEMGTTDHPADEIAALRARRILLNEPLAKPARSMSTRATDAMLESLIRGLQSPLPVECSPLPLLYNELGPADSDHLVTAARLVAVLWLRLTGTVEHVLDLELRVVPGPAFAIHFVGQRARVYSNREPTQIEVNGLCPLTMLARE